MDRYTSETPMEFEYSNGVGPVDGASPFMSTKRPQQRSVLNSQAKKRENMSHSNITGLGIINSGCDRLA